MASRQYGLLLGLIDLLPRTSKTRAAMEDDPEYVELVREAFLNEPEKKEGDSKAPSMKDWSELQDVKADIVDELRQVQAAVIAAAGQKSNPKPYTRPKTLMMQMAESARITKRRLKHEALVNRLVPKKE